VADDPVALSTSESAFLDALRCWGGTVEAAFWDRLGSRARSRLKAAWQAWPAADPEAARERLRSEHEATIRADLGRVDPSWMVRALRDESAAVQRAVLPRLPSGVQESVRNGLGLSPSGSALDRAPQLEALIWTEVLWSERLVGGRSDRADDPLAVVALTRLGRRSLFRLVCAAGLAKWAVARDEPPPLRGRSRTRFESFRRSRGTPTPQLREDASRDVDALANAGSHRLAQLGGITLARLLARVEPYRTRWALQHIPYSMANHLRALMRDSSKAGSAIALETSVLEMAWYRLDAEGLLMDRPRVGA
jgi:hypothetical protein